MKIKQLKEKDILSAIRKEFSVSFPELLLGIGDDAAVVRPGKKLVLLTKDLLIDGVHFISSKHPPFLLGRKSLNVNLSDIAAMGGMPKYALLGLGIPSSFKPDWLEKFFSGLKSAADKQDVALIGGDVSQARKLTVSVTIMGEAKSIITRKGAKPNNAIYVSGTLGNAKQGLLLLKKGVKLGDSKESDYLLKSFLDPSPQVSLGIELNRLQAATSMIDISDGLSVDLLHICQESGCGALIHLDSFPLSSDLLSFQRRPFNFALHGGEDYQLLFSVPTEKEGSIFKLQKKYKITLIGQIIKERRVYVIDRRGRKRLLPARGFQHFD
ncbi:MAG: thiamine-phosphate kinase [Candidatus Aminicenantes bacterium]|nr:thiamine-phosphate kinase [Candidatus Aminicenantes bacterium]